MISLNQKAFLDMIAYSEIGAALLKVSDNGYNVLAGSTPTNPLLFSSYVDHPRIYCKTLNSTAAGRYQILSRYFDAYKTFLHLSDFSPTSQDTIAMQQIKECHAIDNIDAGHVNIAIAQCSRIWASLPGNSYGQPKHELDELRTVYLNLGGKVASA